MLAEQSGRTIGVLTSGGDCSGLNAVIGAVVHRAIQGYGWRVIGILDGTIGLMERPLRTEELTLKLFTGTVLRLGGTNLGTHNGSDPFDFPIGEGKTEDRSAQFIDGYRQLGLDGLIGIGGDGSLKILDRLAQQGGFPFIGVPKTIDNDVPMTEQAAGFSTAVGAAVEALDRLQPTAASHNRVMVLEVMGRDAGHIALYAGIGGGGDVILIPEIPYSMDAIAEQIRILQARGLKHALVVIAEAAREAGSQRSGPAPGGVGHELGQSIAEATGTNTRVTVLGHVQRGGVPDALDRITASAFGARAVDLLAEGAEGRMVAWQHRQVVDVSLVEVNARVRPVGLDDTLVTTAGDLGICLGD